MKQVWRYPISCGTGDVEADRRQGTADPQCLDSHSICTVSGMFQSMSTSTLSSLVPLSNIASFVVERCAVHQHPIYGRWNFHGVVFQPATSNSSSLSLAFRDDPTSLFAICVFFPIFFHLPGSRSRPPGITNPHGLKSSYT
jgi:hypothetical protein